MVEDVFKNVQALKGIGVDDFLLTMGIMSAAVGSDCVGCHPSAGTDHVDWALDTPRKRTARRMVQMVTAINRDNFNGRQVVTCWTCHRGRDRPVTTMTMDVVYGPPTDDPTMCSAGAGVPSVDQVLNKYLQAIGGADNVARITSFVASGRASAIAGSAAAASSRCQRRRRTSARRTSASPSIRIAASASGRSTADRLDRHAARRRAEIRARGQRKDGARLDAMLCFPAQISRR
jgi:hypothetical protein